MSPEVLETRSTTVSVDGEAWFVIEDVANYGNPEVKRLASAELWKLWNQFPHWVPAMKNPDGTHRFACSEELQAKIRSKISEIHPWETVRLYPPGATRAAA